MKNLLITLFVLTLFASCSKIQPQPEQTVITATVNEYEDTMLINSAAHCFPWDFKKTHDTTFEFTVGNPSLEFIHEGGLYYWSRNKTGQVNRTIEYLGNTFIYTGDIYHRKYCDILIIKSITHK